MNSESLVDTMIDWHPKALDCWQQNQYEKAAELYSQAIEAEPEVKSHYWHLGLMLLLQGEEAEAQTTWLVALAEGEPEHLDQWATELVQVLDAEAERQREQGEATIAWVIRQHIREIVPGQTNNLLHLVCLSAYLNPLTVEELEALDVISNLQVADPSTVDQELLLQALHEVLKTIPPAPICQDFTVACVPHIQDTSSFMAVVLPAAVRIAHELKQPRLAADLLEVYRQLDPNNTEILGHLSGFYQNAHCFDQGIAMARLNYELSEQLADKIFASHLLLRGLMTAGGYWAQGVEAFARHRELMAAIVADHPTDLHPIQVSRLFTASSFLPYFNDTPKANRTLQNQLMALCQENVQSQAKERVERYQSRQSCSRPRSSKRLKVGYLSHCMGRHSVGWLARWLIKHHDRSQFELFGYFINDRKYDTLFGWYRSQMDHSHLLSVENANDSEMFADRIAEDDLDVLIDLDSLTLDLTCHILTLKPAPVQVSWLGWDAPGIPAVDYFVADPYVLPDNAQAYYSETIWRLPQTYIAVDGFEADAPSLRRDELGIPADAVIYLSAQKGFKRHADTARLQMKIIKEVPNSYFLIKGPADQASIQRFFEEIAESEGVSCDRLRFLPETDAEATHRANLAIADVVLDTYPYNGATTTLETLWMGVPLVTRVGEQFAARNSYTMLMNVGVEAGIAWTDEEYVEWGVRFGNDAALRQHVHWQLLQSRQTAPLWNAKQFTHEMENAYQEMCK